MLSIENLADAVIFACMCARSLVWRFAYRSRILAIDRHELPTALFPVRARRRIPLHGFRSAISILSQVWLLDPIKDRAHAFVMGYPSRISGSGMISTISIHAPG